MQFLIHKFIVYIQTCICNPCNHVHLNLETDLPSNTTKYMPAEEKIFFTLEFKTLNGKLHLPLLLLMESKLKIISPLKFPLRNWVAQVCLQIPKGVFFVKASVGT